MKPFSQMGVERTRPGATGQGALGESHDTAAEVAHFLSQDEGLRVALQGTADDALDGLRVGDLLALGGRRLVQQVSRQVGQARSQHAAPRVSQWRVELRQHLRTLGCLDREGCHAA